MSMAHFKRRRPKNRRAGCLLCKPPKANGAKGSFCNQTTQEKKAVIAEKEGRRWASARKRPYSIESRHLDPKGGASRVWGGEWTTHKRYHSEEVRDAALEVLQRKVPRFAPRLGGTPRYEYRVGKTRA